MKHTYHRMTGCLLALWICVSCTVREDRSDCPCYVDLDYRQVLLSTRADDAAGRVEVAFYDPACCWTAAHALRSCPEEEEVAVEKGQLQVVAVVHTHPWQHFLEAGTQIVCEPGNEIDALSVHTEFVDCRGETTRCLLQPHKQFTTLTFTDEQDGALCRQYHMVIRGTTCGFEATDFSAVEGPYHCTIQEADESGAIRVRVPRQKRDDLLLEFWDKKEQRLVFTCPVGLYLFASGYDPAAPDLPDCTLRIDFRQALLYLLITDWNEETIYRLYE